MSENEKTPQRADASPAAHLPFLAVEHLSIDVAGKRVLDDVSLALETGEALAIIGASGSGKSTLLSAILGLLSHEGRVVDGDVLYHGTPLLRNTALQKKLAGRDFAMVFQNPGNYLNPALRVRRQYEDFLRTHGVPEKERQPLMEDRLRAVGFSEPLRVLSAYPFQLSGGERQRTATAITLSLSPKLLLLDEPTSALDPIASLEFLDRMKLHQSRGAALIFVTHNIRAGAYLGDRLLILQGGRVVEAGPTQEVMKAPQEAYTKELLAAILEVKS